MPVINGINYSKTPTKSNPTGSLYDSGSDSNQTTGQKVPRYDVGTTIDEVLSGKNTTNSQIDTARQELFGTEDKRKALTAAEEETIRSNARTRVQSYLDAVNSTYDTLRATKEQEGKQRAGQLRAVQNVRGIGGTGMEETQTNQVQNYNAGIVSDVERERNAKIQTILTGADETATKDIEAERLLREKNAKEYISYLQDKQKETQTNISYLAKNGVSLDELSQQQYTNILNRSGMNALEFESFYNSNLPDNMKKKSTDYNVKLPNGNAGIMRVELDPMTGKSVKKEFDLGVSYEQANGKYPGGMKEIDGVLYGITGDSTLVPLTKKTNELKDYPASYQEWALAGRKGTYGDFLKEKSGGTFKPTTDEKSAVNRFLAQQKAPQENYDKASSDSSFFYWVLDQAVKTEGFNIQPFKYPFMN